MGNDRGVREFCDEHNFKHIPEIETNKYGTPLISSIFETAEHNAKYDTLAYVNSDIILFNSFKECVKTITYKKYLLIGQRWDVDVEELIDFTNHNYKIELKKKIKDHGRLHAKTGIDYFVFPKNFFKNIPKFAIGRTSWDNWLVFNARLNKHPVINGTQSIDIIHQNHDYGNFIVNNKLDTKKYKKGIESEINSKLAGGDRYSFNLNDCTHNFINNKIIKENSVKYYLFQIYRFPRLSKRVIPLNYFIDFSFDFLKGIYTIINKLNDKLRFKSS